mgnify:CR=1 FL=1
MKRLFTLVAGLMLAASVHANEIYIEQVGDGLDLDITQDGQDNSIGNSTTGVTLNGDDMTFSITQTGNQNTIDAVIKGNNYTGTWSILGDYNDIDLLCSSVTTGNCDTATLDIDIDGDYTNFNFKLGQTNDADSADISFTIDGDGNVDRDKLFILFFGFSHNFNLPFLSEFIRIHEEVHKDLSQFCGISE